MTKIILTGATGMIGSAIVRQAIAHGVDVTCIANPESPRIKNIPESECVHVVPCDISGYGTLSLDGKYDVFMHLAWNKTSGAERDDVDIQMQNIQYTLDAVRLASRAGCSVFVGAGSQAEYGVQSVPLAPALPVNPESGYGIAKYTAGKFASMLCAQLGLRFNWLRILSVYGPHDGAHTLIRYCVDELRAGRSPELTKAEQMWDYLHCDDAALAFLSVALKGRDGMFYPLGSGKGRRLSEYIEEIRSIIAPNVELEFGKKSYYPHQPMYLVADISELTRDTGWVPKIDFADGIKNLWNMLNE